MSFTRRAFAGIFASGSAALAKTTGFVEHTILRRPYTWVSPELVRSGYQWRSLVIKVSHKAPIRVIVRKPGAESLTEVTVKPTTSLGPYGIQSVVGLDAAAGLVIRIESAGKFTFEGLEARYIIRADRIREWVRTHGETLGESSDMGQTTVVQVIGRVN